MRLVDYVKSIPKTVGAGVLSLALLAAVSVPSKGLEQKLDLHGAQPTPTPTHNSMQVGATLGLPHLVSLRFVYGWDKKVGCQVDISPFFITADMRLRYTKHNLKNVNLYGFLGGMTMTPWIKSIGEPESPTFGVNFGAGVELGKQPKGFYVGAEFGLVIPIEIPADTIGMRMGVNAGYRF